MTIEKKQDFGWSRKEMAKRAALDIPNGSYVNLGIGIPEMVAQYVPEGREVIYHTENGLLGMGPAPVAGELDHELINAGKKAVTALPGASFFHHADSGALPNDFDVLSAGSAEGLVRSLRAITRFEGPATIVSNACASSGNRPGRWLIFGSRRTSTSAPRSGTSRRSEPN